MDPTMATILKGTALVAASVFFVFKYRDISNKKNQYDNFQKQELKDFRSLEKMSEGQQVHVKVKVKPFKYTQQNINQSKMPIHYNQYYLEQPSDICVINQLKKAQLFEPIFPKGSFTFVDSKGKQKQFYKIKHIVGDVFKVDKKYEGYQCGFLKRAWGCFCYFFQTFFDIIRKAKFHDHSLSNIPQSRKPFIMGPVVGMLQYTVSLLTGSYFILKVKFQNGFQHAQVLAQSKSVLLGYYQHQLISTKIQTIFLGFAAIILGYMFYRDVRKWTSFNKILKTFQKGNKKWLNVQNVDQDKACVICYSNCRNLIFFDCKHLIMCWDCYKTVKQDSCPICKKQIDIAKIIMEQKKGNHQNKDNIVDVQIAGQGIRIGGGNQQDVQSRSRASQGSRQ